MNKHLLRNAESHKWIVVKSDIDGGWWCALAPRALSGDDQKDMSNVYRSHAEALTHAIAHSTVKVAQ